MNKEEIFGVLFEKAAVGVALIYTETGKFVRINPKYSEIIGYSSKEIENTDFMSITYAEDLQTDLDNMELLKNGQINEFSMEKRLFRKDGSIVWVNLTVSPLWNTGEKPDFHIAVVIDISDRKVAEERLHYQANLIDNVPDAIISTDKGFIIQSWNKAAELIYGWESNEVIGKRIHDVLKTIYQNGTYQKALEQYLETGHWKGEVVQTRKDNKKISIYSSVSHLKTMNGREIGTVVINRDITKRKQTEEQFLKFKDAVVHSPATIVITNEDGIIEYVNPKFTQLTGFSFEEAVNQNPRVLKSGVMDPEIYKTLWQTIVSGNIWQGELINKKKNGEFYWENALISPIKNIDGKITHFVAVKEDITERKKTEEEIKILNEVLKNRAGELEVLNKELESFSYSVSHDLRNPLNIINGFSKFLDAEYSDKLGKDGKYYIKTIRSNTLRMEQIINDILKLSKITMEKIDFKEVNLSKIVKSIVNDLKNLEPERNVEFFIEPDLIARADEGLIRVVLDNFIFNAWKYTGKKDKAIIEFGVTQYENKTTYFVRDNGAGFDMKYSDKLFIPFKRLHSQSEFEGTGVGLATVQRIINRHSGKVWAEGKPGEGAAFFFTLS